jgi:hypothetical protein
MAVTIGTNSGFVTTAPTSTETGPGIGVDNAQTSTHDTSPSGDNHITEIGWFCEQATQAANFEVGLYADDGGGPGELLFSDTVNAKGTDSGWKTVTGLDWGIDASTEYWIAVQLDDTATTTATIHSTTGGTGEEQKTGVTTLSDPFGTPTTTEASGKATIYALTQDVGEIYLDNTTEEDSGAGSSPVTFSHTCAGNNRGLIVIANTGGATPGTVSGITYDGVAMTLEPTNTDTQRRISIWSLIAPATGANDVVVSWTGSGPEMFLTASSYNNVDQTDMVEATATGTIGNDTSASLSVTSITDGALVFVGATSRNNRTYTLDGSASSRYAHGATSSVASYGADIIKATAGAQTISWTLTGGNDTGPMAGVAIKKESYVPPATSTDNALAMCNF